MRLGDLRSYGSWVYRTFLVLVKYLDERMSDCFTYGGLRRYFEANDLWRYIDYHTLERGVRRLAQLGLLRRVKLKRKMLFCVTEDYWLARNEYIEKYGEPRIVP